MKGRERGSDLYKRTLLLLLMDACKKKEDAPGLMENSISRTIQTLSRKSTVYIFIFKNVEQKDPYEVM